MIAVEVRERRVIKPTSLPFRMHASDIFGHPLPCTFGTIWSRWRVVIRIAFARPVHARRIEQHRGAIGENI
jgi:hypothetical protein